MVKVINIFFLFLILVFFTSTYKYYSSKKNIEAKYFNRDNIDKIINAKILKPAALILFIIAPMLPFSTESGLSIVKVLFVIIFIFLNLIAKITHFKELIK